MKRQIVHIDEDKCDGCGLCVPSCAEGAIQLVDGKARLVSDVYCDGLGDCLGECPQDAITIIERDAEGFDEAAVEKHLASLKKEEAEPRPATGVPLSLPMSPASGGGCPGSAPRSLQPVGGSPQRAPASSAAPSQLVNWPVQLHLVPLQAPYFDGAKLLIAADCVPFAHADFHSELLAGRVLIIGCPKLDDTELYWRKMGAIFQQNDIEEVEVAVMEVPCCNGMLHLVQQALNNSGKDLRLSMVRVGTGGDVLERRVIRPGGSEPARVAQGGRP